MYTTTPYEAFPTSYIILASSYLYFSEEETVGISTRLALKSPLSYLSSKWASPAVAGILEGYYIKQAPRLEGSDKHPTTQKLVVRWGSQDRPKRWSAVGTEILAEVQDMC